MPKLTSSPWPFFLGDYHLTRSSHFPGAQKGRLRWQRSLGPTRTETWTILPQTLVRSDGLILTLWEGILFGHSPEGEELLRLDLGANCSELKPHLLPRLLLVDERERAWLMASEWFWRQQKHVPKEIHPSPLWFYAEWARLFPSGGMIDAIPTRGTDGDHGPPAECAVRVLDDEGNVLRQTDVPRAPLEMRLLSDDEALIRLVDVYALMESKPRNDIEEWIIRSDGELLSRSKGASELAPKGGFSWNRREITLSDSRRIEPTPSGWFASAFCAKDGTVYGHQVGMRDKDGRPRSRLSVWPPSGDQIEPVVQEAPVSEPVYDCEDAAHLLIQEKKTLALLCQDKMERRFSLPLASSHEWKKNQWDDERYCAQLSIGAGGTTIVALYLRKGDCLLFCVE
jgi:hypothetical protein